MEPVREQPALAGRVTERAALVALVRRAVEGRPGAVLVHGEAGVGKTSLVRSVADEVRADGVQVLWGSGLRFDAAEALLLPITMALDRWLRDADPDTRERALAGVPGVSAVLPSLGRPADEVTETRRVVVVDALLNRILELGPALLVVDDVQWADQASLTALAYLIAGFSRQPLALVTTHRDEESHHADEFRTWFADMRRMPSVDVLALERLDRETTRSQVAGLIGAEPTDTLLDQVFRRSEGNAYLTELLVSETGPHAEVLPEPLPTALQDALLSAWQRLCAHGARPDQDPGRRGTAHGAVGSAVTSSWRWMASSCRPRPCTRRSMPASSSGPAENGLVPPPPARRRADGAVPPGRGCVDPCGLGRCRWRARAQRASTRCAVRPRWHCTTRPRATRTARSRPASGQRPSPRSNGSAARGGPPPGARRDALGPGAPDPGDAIGAARPARRVRNRCATGPTGAIRHTPWSRRARELVDEVADPLRASRLLMDWAELEWSSSVTRTSLGGSPDLVRAAELAALGARQR